MARVAYLMDRIMKALGLHGRAFVPMLSGFACCGSGDHGHPYHGAFSGSLADHVGHPADDLLCTPSGLHLDHRGAVSAIHGVGLGPCSRAAHGRDVSFFRPSSLWPPRLYWDARVVKGRSVPLLLELPPYRMPGARAVVRQMWDRAVLFLKEAGSVILVATVVLWALLSFPKAPPTPAAPTPSVAAAQASPAPAAPTEAQQSAAALEHSYGGRLGKALEPVIRPLGFDWKIGVGIIGAFAAREVFVSTLGLVYGIGDDVDEESDSLREKNPSGKNTLTVSTIYTPLTGLSLMVFFALACQCMSTLAVLKRETRSWRWPAFLFVYMTGLAYLASLLVFQLGKLFGFS